MSNEFDPTETQELAKVIPIRRNMGGESTLSPELPGRIALSLVVSDGELLTDSRELDSQLNKELEEKVSAYISGYLTHREAYDAYKSGHNFDDVTRLTLQKQLDKASTDQFNLFGRLLYGIKKPEYYMAKGLSKSNAETKSHTDARHYGLKAMSILRDDPNPESQMHSKAAAILLGAGFVHEGKITYDEADAFVWSMIDNSNLGPEAWADLAQTQAGARRILRKDDADFDTALMMMHKISMGQGGSTRTFPRP